MITYSIAMWLLVSVGNGTFTSGAQPTLTVARFESAGECEKTRAQILGAYETKPRLVCVSAQAIR